jgi:hypothetical protein
MTLELPLLRLGVAGFTAEQQQAIARMLAGGASEATLWELGDMDAADGWWLNGARTHVLDGNRIAVAPGVPTARTLQLHLPDIDRPLACARPLPPGFDPLCDFQLESPDSMKVVLGQFETWLAPLTAQICLAAHIVEHQSALAPGKYELRLNSELLALVDMRGQVAVRATLSPADFDGTHWRRTDTFTIPEHFARTSLAQLMWQYTERTHRDLLPAHYRGGLLYFRRAPHLPQRMLRNSHLLIMRELMIVPTTFEELQQRCGMDEARLARDLASLYFVGSITSNPKRAAPTPARASGADSLGNLDSVVPSELPAARRPQATDLTAPAPIRADH